MKRYSIVESGFQPSFYHLYRRTTSACLVLLLLTLELSLAPVYGEDLRIDRPATAAAAATATADSSLSRITRPEAKNAVTGSGSTPAKAPPVVNQTPAKDKMPPVAPSFKPAAQAQPQLIKQTPKLADEKPSAPAKQEKPAAPPVVKGSGSADMPEIAGEDKYPVVGRLENLTFGRTSPDRDVASRLSSLENSIFARTYSEESLFDRTERLKRTLLGTDTYDPAMAVGAPDLDPYAYTDLDSPVLELRNKDADFSYLDEMAKNPDNREEQPLTVLQAYCEELINFERRKRNLEPLENDKLIQDMAEQQMVEMLELRQLSHSDQYGQNPDRRYTLGGGTDAISEGLVAVSTADLPSSKLTKAAVCVLLKKMLMRQDDREALLSAEATHLASSFGVNRNGTKLFGCTEVLTRHSKMEPLAKTAKLGEKVTVAGEIFKPYQFDKITLAWEEALDSPIEEEPGSDEALPYFPPLDYVAYDTKSERDHTKAITALKAIGVMAAIAGGMFVPPVALAAPLIVLAGPGASEMRPQSDIPVKGGVKLSGSNFKVHLPLDNENQGGLYYVTVWASLGEGSKPFAVSRRAILVTGGDSKEETNKKKDTSQENSQPIEYTNGDENKDGNGNKNGDGKSDSQDQGI
ncbi:MAG: hypothetical protein H6677_15435 [Candidatus Obscuribacterales bacterium]|nr:hypothetical protein [Candidatus Obscuribacterales bacterium]